MNRKNTLTNDMAALADAVADRLSLYRMENAAREFLHAGKLEESFLLQERALMVRRRLHGPDPKEFWQYAKFAGELANTIATKCIEKEDYGLASKYLKKAEILTEKDISGRSVTYNNWACYCRQQGKPELALEFLQRALELQLQLESPQFLADNYLNLGVVLSQLNRHEEALENIQLALPIIMDEVFGGDVANAAAGPDGITAVAENAKPERIALLLTVYHTMGAEHEFLKQFTQAMQCYSKAVDMGKSLLGETHVLTTTINASQVSAARAIQAEKRAKEMAAAAVAEAQKAAKSTS